MVKIQIVTIFTTMDKLGEKLKVRTKEIVAEEYSRIFGISQNEIEMTIFDGRTSSPYDVIISIEADRRRLNEGVLRGNLRDKVSSRLAVLYPSELSFQGRIHIQDGSIPVPQNTGKAEKNASSEESENDYTKRAANYKAEEPKYGLDKVKLPEKTLTEIEKACARIEYEHKVFDEWGLYAIMPNPVAALSFYGPPGTGKTLAAQAIAHKLGKKIITVSYADIESKFHGEGPKNVCAIFLAAEQQDAVLFIDEADSLLSKRLSEVTQGSEQAINSMRSQLLINLEKFHGVVIFATNLIVNYDQAFMSRLINIEFTLPDEKLRTEIWKSHLYDDPDGSSKVRLKIPLADDVDTEALGRDYPVCGRNIRNAVVNACVTAVMRGKEQVNMELLREAIAEEIEREKKAREAADHTKGNTEKKQLTPETKQVLIDSLQKQKDEADAKNKAAASVSIDKMTSEENTEQSDNKSEDAPREPAVV